MSDVNLIRECIADGRYEMAFGYARDMVRTGTATEETNKLLHIASAYIHIANGEKANKLHAPSYFADAAQHAFTAGDEELFKRASVMESKARKRLWRSAARGYF